MKFIKKFENFTEMESHEMEEMCPECQCKMAECECGGPMGFEEEEEGEMDGPMSSGMPSYFEEEEEMLPMAHEEEEEEEEMMPSGHRMGHIMSFQESKKSTKKKSGPKKPDFPDVDGDGDKKESISKASADKKKADKEDKKEDKKDDNKSTKKGGLSKSQEKKLPEGLRKAIKAGVRD